MCTWRSIILLLLASLIRISAADNYQNDFNGENGILPFGWSMIADEGAPPCSIQNNDLRCEHGTGFVLLLLDETTDEAENPQQWTDYTITAKFRSSGSALTGLVARWSATGNYGYHARLKKDGEQYLFELYRIGGPGGSQLLGIPANVPYVIGQTWTMSLAAIGNTITATLDNKNDEQQAQISVNDTTFSSGQPGLRGNPYKYVSVWESVQISMAP